MPFDKFLTPIDLPKSASDPWPFFLRLTRILTAQSTPEAIMADVLDTLITLDDISACWIGQPDANGKIIPMPGRGVFPDAFVKAAMATNVTDGAHGEGPAGRAWRSGEPKYTQDWRGDPHLAHFRELTAALDWRSAAAVPLRGRGMPHSLLVIYSNKLGFFPDIWSLDVLAQLGAVIGNALENREKHKELLRSQLLYRTLFDGAGLLLLTRDEPHMLRGLCKRLVDSGLFQSVAVGQVDVDGLYRYRTLAAKHHAREMRGHRYKFIPGERNRPLMLTCWESGRTEIANHYLKDDRFVGTHAMAIKTEAKALGAFPIMRNGKRWAVMSVAAAKVNYFDARLIELLERLCGLVGHALDELDLKAALRAEREAQSRIARQDTLTQLPNRLAFQEKIATAMARAMRHQNIVGIGIIDLDDFKQINDNWGHGAGDLVLRVVGERLRAMLREIDFVARIGGDEFALILEDWNWSHDIDGFCGRLHEAIHGPITLPNGEMIRISLSAGFTLYPLDNATPELLLRHADTALYAAKAAKGRFEKFWRLYLDVSAGTKDQFQGRLLLQSGALQVHYQPVMDLRSGQIISVEALARLKDGNRLIPPAKFLRDLLLDDRNMLFRQMVETGVKQLRQWDQEGFTLGLAVNVDAQILLLDRTLPYLKSVLAQAGIAPRRLALEILETHDFLDLKKANTQIDAARAHGIRIVLDDLGAGYSSILKIRELRLDVVKLDRAFVAGLREQPDDLMFVSVFQTLTAALGMQLIVEGVETPDVLDALRMMGTTLAQGFVIARPMSGAAFTTWLRKFEPKPAAREPMTLLGAYAVHLSWLRAMQLERTRTPILNYLRSNNPFSLDRFFADQKLHGTALHGAYQALQDLLQTEAPDRQSVLDAAEGFRHQLIDALKL